MGGGREGGGGGGGGTGGGGGGGARSLLEEWERVGERRLTMPWKALHRDWFERAWPCTILDYKQRCAALDEVK